MPKLSAEELAEIRRGSELGHLTPKETDALLDHITALEEQQKHHAVICQKRIDVLAEARGLLNEAKYPPKVADGCLSGSIAHYVRLLLEERGALRSELDPGLITCVSDEGGGTVQIKFQQLHDAQKLHKHLLELRHGR